MVRVERRVLGGERRVEGGEGRVREREASELALRYRSGEREVLGELYGELEPVIRGFLKPRLANPRSLPACVEVADLEQQAYVALAEAALDWDPERNGSFLPYFLRSFPWRIDRYIRSQTPSRRSGHLLLSSLPHDLLMRTLAARPGEDGREWDDAIGCSELMGVLSRAETLVVRLHLYHGLSFAETGRIAGLSHAGAHASFAQAMAVLRGWLEI